MIPCSKILGSEQPRVGKRSMWGHFRSWFLILTTNHHSAIGFTVQWGSLASTSLHLQIRSDFLQNAAGAGMQVHLGEGSVGLLQPPRKYKCSLFNYFPFPKLKVPMILFLLLLIRTLKPSVRNLDPCLADGRNPWNLVDPEPKSPSSRFLCQITARLPAPHPSPQCCSPLHKGECAPGWMFIVYMSPIHLGRSHPVITGPGRRHLLLGSSDLSPMWSLSHVPPPLSMFYLPHVVCQFEVGSFSFLF